MIPLLTALIAGTAQAADITALPPAMRGDVGLAYGVKVVPDVLLEDDTVVGRRRAIDHTITYSGTIGLTDIFAFEIALPHAASSRVRFFDSYRMAYEPNQGTGTAVGTDLLTSNPEIHGTGLGGTRFSFAVTPFSEDTYASRGDAITWLMRIGYQLPDKTNIWTFDGGDRGAMDGASGMVLETAFSTTNRMSQPYMGLRYDKRMPVRMDIVDKNGDVAAKEVQIKPASTVSLTTGLEIELHKNHAFANGLGTSVSLDPYARFAWRSAAEIPSGVYLPSVLTMTKNTLVAQGETSEAWAGLGIKWRIIEYLDWKTTAEMGTPFAYKVEHPYEVTTGMGKLGWQVGTSLTFRMRDPIFDPPVQ